MAAVTSLLGAVAIGALAQVTSVPGAVGVALLIGLSAGLSGALCGALVQAAAGPAYVGRVTAASTLVGFGVAPLTFPVVGWAAELWGTGPVFVVGAVVSALGGVIALCAGSLRRAELPK